MGIVSWLRARWAGAIAQWAGRSAQVQALGEMVRARLVSPDGAAALGLPVRSRSGFDRAMDALNRLPRPLMAMGTLVIFATALISPVWFAARMEALAQVPEPLWWLIGAVISLFFGARLQSHDHQLQRDLAGALTTPGLPVPTADSTPLAAATGPDARLTLAAETTGQNPALERWLAKTA